MDADLAYYHACLAAARAGATPADIERHFNARLLGDLPPRPRAYSDQDLINAILAVADPAAATRFFRGLRAELETEPARTMAEATVAAQRSIGWCFGEGMAPERRTMWRAVCGARHPFLGAMEHDPSFMDTLMIGYRLGAAGGDFPGPEADDALPEH